MALNTNDVLLVDPPACSSGCEKCEGFPDPGHTPKEGGKELSFWKRFFRRRRFVVDSDLQLRLLVHSLAYVVFFLFVTAFATFFPLMSRLQDFSGTQDEIWNAAAPILYLHERFWPAAGLALFVILLHSLRSSHRIAGPLYRFKRVFRAIGEGTIPKGIKLRKRDLLMREMDEVNFMIRGLSGKLEEIKREGEMLNEVLDRLQKPSIGSPSKDKVYFMNEVAEKSRRLVEKLDAFHVEQ